MKSFFKHHWVFVLGVVALAIQVVVLAAIPERIRWKWHDRTIYELSDFNGASLALGLRNDGVVVWREIMPAVTNSPAEQAEAITNMVMTNWFRPEWTNITIKPIYIPPWHHPEWTNWEEGARWWSNQIKPFPGVILTNELYWNIGTNNFIPLHTVTPWSKTEKEYLTNETYYGK